WSRSEFLALSPLRRQYSAGFCQHYFLRQSKGRARGFLSVCHSADFQPTPWPTRWPCRLRPSQCALSPNFVKANLDQASLGLRHTNDRNYIAIRNNSIQVRPYVRVLYALHQSKSCKLPSFNKSVCFFE